MTIDLNRKKKTLIVEYEISDVLEFAARTDENIAWEALVSVYNNWDGGDVDSHDLADAYWDTERTL